MSSETFQIHLVSFGFKRGAPQEAELILDVRFLSNPFYQPELEPMSGLDAPVIAFIESLPETDAVFLPWQAWLLPWLTTYAQKGKPAVTIAIGCTGGKHRSVYWLERAAKWLQSLETIARLPVVVHLEHRDRVHW